MDATLKAKWVEALRSDEYRQATGRFERDGAFCCLGVLCKVAGEPAWRNDLGGSNWKFADATLGPHVYALVSMNDNERKSFPEIADYIEVNL